MTLKELLKNIKCKRTYLRKSSMTSGNAYRITLTYKGEKCSFVFNDNHRNESRKNDFLYCLVLDAQAYDLSRDIGDFIKSFGYADEWQSGVIAYNACKKQSERLHRLFNDEEVELLSTIE